MSSLPDISTLGERALVARLQQRLGPVPAFVRLSIGDDAAVLEPERGMQQVMTTDSLVEGVHFRRDWTPIEAVGHKALAVNLSDLAAMGAAPRIALLSLILPADLPLADFDALLDGFLALATRTGTTLVGGNMARSPGPIVVDVTAAGSVRRRSVLTRRGASPGDRLFVTGSVGGPAAALEMLRDGRDRSGLDLEALDCLARLERPEPRLKLGRIVGRTRAANAAIDLSDGLADAAVRLSAAAGLGIVVDAAAVPVHAGAIQWWSAREVAPVPAAMAGGEDYELAFAVRPRQRSRFLAAARRCPDVRVTDVGEFTKEPGAWLLSDGEKRPLSQETHHF